MSFDLTQLGILALSGTGIWLVGRPESWRRVGYILGLTAQPVWFYMSVKAELWGVALLTLFCTYGWAQGVWFHWFRSERVLPETPPANLMDTQTPNKIVIRSDENPADTDEFAPPTDEIATRSGEIARNAVM